MDIRIDIPDEVLLRRWGERMPWLSEEDRAIPVVRRLTPDGQPDIHLHSVRNLRRDGLHFPFRKEYESRRMSDLRCFYSGSRLYLVTVRMLEHTDWKSIPWAATREHVAAKRGNDRSLVNTLGNMVPCGRMINKMAGHVPLVVKLYIRDRLSEFEFDRDAMTHETSMEVRDAIIGIRNPFWFEGNFPWFSHVYKDKACEDTVLEFKSVLQKYEDLFLSMSWQDQRALLYRPSEIDLVDITRRVLGIRI